MPDRPQPRTGVVLTQSHRNQKYNFSYLDTDGFVNRERQTFAEPENPAQGNRMTYLGHFILPKKLLDQLNTQIAKQPSFANSPGAEPASRRISEPNA